MIIEHKASYLPGPDIIIPEEFQDEKKYVVVRTDIDGVGIYGIVERKRLADWAKMCEMYTYSGYTSDIPDPDFQLAEGVNKITISGSDSDLPKEVQEVFIRVANKNHQNYGKRPGEPFSPLDFSSDKLAMLITLFQK